MRYRIILGICTLFFVASFVSSCEYETIVPSELELPDVVSFSSHLIPVFDASCNSVGCHDQNHFALDLTAENAYFELTSKKLVDIINPDSSVIHITLTESVSHEGRTTPRQHGLIHKWIQQGAKNN